MPTFKAGEYFNNVLTLNRALDERNEQFHDTRPHAPADSPEAKADTAIWMGCNVLRTPHIARLAIEIMRLLNPKLSVLGGPLHCCGSPIPDADERASSLQSAVAGFRAENVPQLVSWCPSCHTNLRKGSDPSQWGFDELHVTEYLFQRLDRLPLRHAVPMRVMLHGHTGAPDRDKDMLCCRRLLEAVPGLTIVGEHSDPQLGLHCVPMALAPVIGEDGYERRFKEVLERAYQAGAEAVATIYHSCYRELERRTEPGRVGVENYIVILARALGIDVPRNLYREFAHGTGQERDAIKAAAAAGGVNEEHLDSALGAEFPK